MNTVELLTELNIIEEQLKAIMAEGQPIPFDLVVLRDTLKTSLITQLLKERVAA